MYKKLCPKCHQPSFSSGNSGKWICPSCQSDLSRIKHQDAEILKQNKPQLYLIKNRYTQHIRTSKQQVSPYIFKSFD